MAPKNLLIFIGVIFTIIYKSYCFQCGRIPDAIYKPRNRNDAGKYVLDILGNPKTYNPNQHYNISLKWNPMSHLPGEFRRFIVTLEPHTSEDAIDPNIHPAPGNLDIVNSMSAKFSDRCPNTVIEANTLPKTEVQLFWNAPPPSSGCVAIKATVVESRDSWYSEDGHLTRILCEETIENENVQPEVLDKCCACDEAKYEIAFQGLWTRNTHPKDFPSDIWTTKFSDVIGASHKYNHAFWEYGSFASDGLKELAEDGDTKTLEQELKDNNQFIRTIIKARGLQHPNLTESTFAVFRVDRENHLVSVVSKITPSPDWIVGVSSLELCKEDCEWEETRVLNLYPWDVGTDDGIKYDSDDLPASHRNQIRRIKSNSPNDPKSPFYDENGEEINPIAKLILTRQKIYEKQCPDQPDEGEEENNENCKTTEWSDWSICTNRCGQGVMYRQRQLENPENEDLCPGTNLTEQQECFGRAKYCTNKQNIEEVEEKISPEDPKCELGDWGKWSSCSATCGNGTKTRDRNLKNPYYSTKCNIGPSQLEDNKECKGEGEECENEANDGENSNCPNSVWNYWSSCNVTCGNGFKRRYRVPVNEYDDDANKEEEEEEEEKNQNSCPNQEIVECYEEPCDEDRNLFGKIDTGNHVRGSHLNIVEAGSDGPVVNCEVSSWSTWSPCVIDDGESCGQGHKTRVREIRVHDMNGGKPCPRILIKRKPCKVPCSEEVTEHQTERNTADVNPTWGPARLNRNTCRMSRWTNWSPCSTICGDEAVQQRTRYPIYRPLGVNCPSRFEQRKCPLPAACTDQGRPIF